jgi:hypothetical protein
VGQVGALRREVQTMPRGDVEAYYEDGLWKNKIEGNERASNVHEVKAAAVGAARQMAMLREVEHMIRNMDGTIGERNSYGNDPGTSPAEIMAATPAA